MCKCGVADQDDLDMRMSMRICMCFRLSLSKFWGVHGMLKWQDQGYQSNVTLPPQAKRPPAEHEGPTAEQIEERKARLAMRKLEQQMNAIQTGSGVQQVAAA